MRNTILLVILCFGLATTSRGADKPDYTDLSRRIQEAVVAKMPRQYEDLSGWGKTVPAPTKQRFPRLKRTVIRVGDRLETPHGTWKRTKVWVADPARDVQVQVRDVRKVGKNTSRIRVEATAALQGERERKDWQKGLQLLGVTVQADAVVTIGLDVDVTITLNTEKLPPELNVDAKVANAQIVLRDFNVRRVGRIQLSPGDMNELSNELRASIQERLKTYEPQVKEHANRAIAETLQKGNGLFLQERMKDER